MAELEKISCRYEFTTEEKRKISERLAEGVSELQRLENEKKAISSQLKAQIDSAAGRIRADAERIRSGWEYREMPCIREMDFDAREILWFREDNGDLAARRPMVASELQMEIEFEAKNAKPKIIEDPTDQRG